MSVIYVIPNKHMPNADLKIRQIKCLKLDTNFFFRRSSTRHTSCSVLPAGADEKEKEDCCGRRRRRKLNSNFLAQTKLKKSNPSSFQFPELVFYFFKKELVASADH